MSLQTAASVPTSELISALRAEAAPVRSNPDAKINLLDAVFEMAATINAIASVLLADLMLNEIEQNPSPQSTSPELPN